MYMFMSLYMTKPSKHLVTLCTLVWFDTSMYTFVCLQSTLLCKRLVTVCTLVWFDTCMDTSVSNQLTFLIFSNVKLIHWNIIRIDILNLLKAKTFNFGKIFWIFINVSFCVTALRDTNSGNLHNSATKHQNESKRFSFPKNIFYNFLRTMWKPRIYDGLWNK